MQLQLPIHKRLEHAERILLAGAGGGFDVFAGLPLYFQLKEAGKDVHLANLSFTALNDTEAERLGPALVKVDADTDRGRASYFPELHLAQWFREDQNSEVTIYCFDHTGVAPIVNAYADLVDLLGVDTILLVDGGTDSLMRGDEFGLATAEEDVASIIAAAHAPVERKALCSIGFGVDSYHGICHYQWLNRVADHTRDGGFLGAWSLVDGMPGVDEFREALAFANNLNPRFKSVVCNCIASALDGEYGDFHATQRTAGSTLWINPLMPLYWCFDLDAVYRNLLYAKEVENTHTIGETNVAIGRYRSGITPAEFQEMPG